MMLKPNGDLVESGKIITTPQPQVYYAELKDANGTPLAYQAFDRKLTLHPGDSFTITWTLNIS